MPDVPLHVVDGSIDWSGGIDSSRVTTVQSETNPNGLGRNQLAYLVNGTLRDGAILPRTGWKWIKTIVPSGSLYQGGLMYAPDNADPYLLLSLSGHIFQVPCSAAPDVDLSTIPALTNPATEPQAYFVQGEQFGIIQAGDYLTSPTPTLPLFWNGANLFRSPGIPGNQLPAGGPMCYYKGRLWYAVNGRTYAGGDIVRGASGTAPYDFRDAILHVTENPMCIGGDGFVVPNNAGNIRAIAANGSIDTSTGQGQLYIFTTKAVYALTVPETRQDWINMGAPNAGPVQNVVQLTNGAVGDRSIVAVNGDLFYQSLEPGIRSLMTAIRYFGQWSNTPISANIERLIEFEDRALMHLSSGIVFQNRLLMGMRPVQTAAGVADQAIVSLDFLPVASFGRRLPPCWEGHFEGVKVLQLFSGVFGGLERAFAVVVADDDGSIQLWELTDYLRWDENTHGQDRVTMVIDFPAYNANDPFQLKRLAGCEIWLDKLLGTVDFKLEYRPDGDPCWYFWHAWQMCSQKDCTEDPMGLPCYPEQLYRENFAAMINMPKPPDQCANGLPQRRPAYICYQAQCRLWITGWARVRGFLPKFQALMQPPYDALPCPPRTTT